MWVGLSGDVAPDGTVATGYPTRWATTHEPGQAWGYNVLDTSAFGFGASQIFEHECFGSPVQSGDPALCPQPTTPEDSAELFNRVGALWKDTFAHAVALGVGTVLGTEIPLSTPPPPPPAPTATLPLQLWFSAARNDHFITTTACAECDNLYVFLGTTGWVYSANETGSTPLCTYARSLPNGQIDNTLAPCDPKLGTPVRIEGYAPPAGAPGTTAPLTQYTNAQGHHWAADAFWGANATASGFTAAGPIAPVFSTGPPVPTPPDAQAYYEGIFTRLTRLLGPNLTYYWGWTPEGWEWDKVDINNPLIQDGAEPPCRAHHCPCALPLLLTPALAPPPPLPLPAAVKDVLKMQAAHDAVSPSFALASCGWTVGPLGARWYYDTVLPPSWTISSIDMDVGNTPVDPAYANITHRTTANKWAIPWAEDDPGLTAPELWVNRSLAHARDAAAYGVGGLLSIHWRTRMTSPQIGSAHAVAWNLSLAAPDYWRSWALGQFGDPAVAAAAAAVFSGIDSFDTPRPVQWIGGPGGFAPGGCGQGAAYAFVDALVAQRPALLAAIAAGTARLAHLERFDYWAGQLVYMRSIPTFTCDWASYNGVIAAIEKIADPAARRAAAIARGVPARVSLMANFTTVMQNLLATVSTIEGSGTVYNVLSHSTWAALGPAPTAALQALTGAPLPAAALPPPGYSPARPPQARVQVVRTMLAAGEPLSIRAVVLTSLAQAPTAATLFYGPPGGGGGGGYAQLPLVQAAPAAGVARFVFTGELPAQPADFAWYVRVDLPANTTAYTEGLGLPAGTVVSPGGVACFVPPGGAAEPQSVVIVPQ